MQTANNTLVLTITGRAGSGKDTAADYLVMHFGFTKLSWAGPLKAALASMGFPEPANRDDKEKLVPGFDFTWRRAAQTLGTEWGRALDTDIWTKIVMAQIAAAPAGSRFVISDSRFENEAAQVRSAGGMVLHVQGRAVDLGAAAAHVSEEPVRILNDDWLLVNNASVEYLHSQMEALMKTLSVEARQPCHHKWFLAHKIEGGPLAERCTYCYAYRDIAVAQ